MKINTSYLEPMIAVYAGHISKETKEMLDSEGDIDLIVYDKPTYGWFVYVPSEEEPGEELENRNLPEDIRTLLEIAKENEAVWLMLDVDAQEIDGLPKYEW